MLDFLVPSEDFWSLNPKLEKLPSGYTFKWKEGRYHDIDLAALRSDRAIKYLKTKTTWRGERIHYYQIV